VRRNWNGSTLGLCLLTAWSRVLLEKITGFQLVKKFPTFHGSSGVVSGLAAPISNLQQTKNETTNVLINIIVVSS